MSNSTIPPQGSLQSKATVLGPGIAGLFLQGIESGLVVAEFCRWFSMERNDGAAFSSFVVFVTVVGLGQSGIYFASVWRRYVQDFGNRIEGPDWTDYNMFIPTVAVAIPVQAFMIRLCYQIVRKNLYIIAPLVLLLATSIASSIWAIVSILRFEVTVATRAYHHLPASVGISWPYLITLLVPSVLDVALTGILLYRLTRTMKRVYNKRIRRHVLHLMTIVWQSAIPPTLCTIVLCILYIYYATARWKELEFWYTVVQSMIGKLYVLSLFYIIIDSGPATGEEPSEFVPTLTIPIEGCGGLDVDSGVLVSSHRCPSARGSSMSVNTAV